MKYGDKSKKEYVVLQGKKMSMSQMFDQDARLIPYTQVLLDEGANISDLSFLKENQKVKVIGFTKGRGFAGTIKRYGFHRGPMTHGWSKSRSTGSIGTQGQGRVIPGKKMPGRMGQERKSYYLRYLGLENNLIKLRGSVPGSKYSKVLIYIEKQ